MSNFSGFSQDDIKQLYCHEELKSPITKDHKESKFNKKTIKHNYKNNIVKMALENKINSSPMEINGCIQHNLSTIEEQDLDTTNGTCQDAKGASILSTRQELIQHNHCLEKSQNDATSTKPNDCKVEHIRKSVDDLQSKQKLIEEQNRKRKELLAKELQNRTKRTLEEQQKLQEINDEFKKLDLSLSNDVGVLRKQIEVASCEYMDAEKRYSKIEKEFLDAKMYLFKKREKKEMLTEHLCTIIERNEEQKAKKLTDLLNKLQINEQEGDAIGNSD